MFEHKAAVCYYSRHHGNTRAVLEAMAQEGPLDLIDVTAHSAVRLEEYDWVGFASGIYFGSFHPSVLALARRSLPRGTPVFFVCTYGGVKGFGPKALWEIAQAKGCPVLGTFSCKGYDTYGPFRLVGGLAKGRPNRTDLENARSFWRGLRETYERGVQT